MNGILYGMWNLYYYFSHFPNLKLVNNILADTKQ